MAEKKDRPTLTRRKPAKVAPPSNEFQTLDFGRKNWMILGVAFGCIVLGFIALALGDTTISPILLVGAYVGLIPWALVARHRQEKAASGDSALPGSRDGA